MQLRIRFTERVYILPIGGSGDCDKHLVELRQVAHLSLTCVNHSLNLTYVKHSLNLTYVNHSLNLTCVNHSSNTVFIVLFRVLQGASSLIRVRAYIPAL